MLYYTCLIYVINENNSISITIVTWHDAFNKIVLCRKVPSAKIPYLVMKELPYKLLIQRIYLTFSDKTRRKSHDAFLRNTLGT